MTHISNFQDTARAGLTGKFIALKSYIRKKESSRIINLSFHLKKAKKQEQIKPKQAERNKWAIL